MKKTISVLTLHGREGSDQFKNYIDKLENKLVYINTFYASTDETLYIRNQCYYNTYKIILLGRLSIKDVLEFISKIPPCGLENEKGDLYYGQEWIDIFR